MPGSMEFMPIAKRIGSPVHNKMKEKFLNTYTGVFIKEGDMYIAYAEEIPGANTQGKTIEEARKNLKEAIELILKTNISLSRKNVNRRKLLREKIFISILKRKDFLKHPSKMILSFSLY
jgi:predicted RNase H-like HicB family nuclease